MNVYWPIILAVFSDVFYQICTKSLPNKVNPFASLTITYLVGAVVCFIIFFISSKNGSFIAQLKSMNWTTFILGLSIVGLEAGSIYMYKVGWNLNTGYIVKSIILAITLIIVGYFLYKEEVNKNKIIGMIFCLFGLFLINK